MTYRKVKYLTNSKEFRELIVKYRLKFRVIDNQKIIVFSDYLIFEIYGFCTEVIFYFDIYTADLKWYSNVDRLLEGKDKETIKFIYNLQVIKRNRVLIKSLQGSESNTLKAEQHFFTYIQLLDELLNDFLTCKNISQCFFSPTSEYKRTELKKLLN